MKKNCKTCEWKFRGGICANVFYGHKINDIQELKDKNYKCSGWSISIEEHFKQQGLDNPFK